MIALSPGILDTLKRKKALEGHAIRLSDAARKYDMYTSTLTRWVEKGLIRIINRDPTRKLLEVDEADVQLAVRVFNLALDNEYNSRQAGWVLKRAMDAINSD